MTPITSTQVQELRRRTGAGMMACKAVLSATGGDIDRAVEVLRKQGIAKAESRETRPVGEGTIGSYVHHTSRIGAMVALACETDFVARTEAFRTLARQLAEQVAAAAPLAIEFGGVDPSVVAERRTAYEQQVRASGKPEALVAQIVAGKLAAFAKDVVLLEQAWIREPKKAIGELVAECSARLGERIVVQRITRFELGDPASSRTAGTRKLPDLTERAGADGKRPI
ncbi:MAG: elongation factor Ts [bacterium]